MNSQELYNRARSLMDVHGLHDWKFEVGRSRKRFGVCKSGRRKIIVSGPLSEVNTDAKVIDTILHEIAHAMVGAGHGHDEVWRRQAVSIGCDGKRCYGEDVVTVKAPLKATCAEGHTFYRQIRPRGGRRHSCPSCSPRFDERYLLRWEPNNEEK